jgi:DnaJ-class molecular chaperone
LTDPAAPPPHPTPPRAGDVIFKLRQSAHPRFRREGDDLHHDLHLTLREALVGFRKVVKHLDGRDVALTHRGVTQPFEVRKVAGEGMPQHNYPSQHGTLHVKYIVDLPTTLTQDQIDAIERLFQ